MQVTNKVFLTFFLQKAILLDTDNFSISASSKNIGPLWSKIFFSKFQYHQRLKFLYPILYVIISFYVF